MINLINDNNLDNESLFPNELYDSHYPDGIEFHYWNIARFKIINQSIIDNIDIPIKGISIGCGKGVDIKSLRDYGIDIVGIEPSDIKPIKSIREYVTTNISPFSDNKKLNGHFNTVFLLEVLEHLKEPGTYLNDILKTYTNAQYIIITVPARSEIFSNYDIEVGHVKRYKLKDIDLLAKTVGMEVVFKKYIFNILYLFTLIWLFFIKKRPTIVKAPKVHMRKFHYFLGSIIALENIFFPSFIYGSSIISILKINRKKGK